MIPVKEIEAEWIRIFEFVRGEKPTVRLTDLVKSKWPKLHKKMCISWGFARQAIITGLLDQSGVDVIGAERDCDCIECIGKDQNNRPHDIDALVKLGEYNVPIQIGVFDGSFHHDDDIIVGSDGEPAPRKYINGVSYRGGGVDKILMAERDSERIRHKIRETPPGGITLLVIPSIMVWESDDWWYDGVDKKCIVLCGMKPCSVYYGGGGRLDAAKELCSVLGCKDTHVKSVKARHSKNPKHETHLPFCPRTASGLTEAVQHDTEKWTANSDDVIGVLYYPAYASAYFRGVRNANGMKTDSLAPIILYVVKQYVASRTERADDESGWRGVVSDIMHTLENLLSSEKVKFGAGVLKDIGRILQVIMSGRYEDHKCDTLNVDEIDNRLHLQAFFCLTHVVIYRLRDGTPPDVLETLTAAAKLGGQEGREHRIVLGCALTEGLQGAIPDWYKENESLLFGEDSPDGMNVVLMRVYLRDGLPDKQTMEKYHALVLEVLTEGMLDMRMWESKTGGRVTNDSIMHFMISVLYDWRGYGIEDSVRDLARIGPDAMSIAAHECGWLMMQDSMKEFVGRAVQFWEAVLDSSPAPEALYGFGWWALAKSVDQDTWERLMLRTCEAANGIVEDPSWVIRRASSGCKPTESGIRIIDSVSRANK